MKSTRLGLFFILGATVHPQGVAAFLASHPRSHAFVVSSRNRRNYAFMAPAFVIRSTSPDNEYVEIFRDDFETLDQSIWKYDLGRGPNNDGWGNGEKQTYTDSPENAFVKDSILHIKIIKQDTPTEDGCYYTSARLTTSGTFNFTFGRVDTRVRLQHTNGPFSAVWALSDKVADPKVGWPLCGEIDFFEYQAIWDYTPSTLHFQDRHGGDALSFHNTLLTANEWHDICMEWTPDYIAFLQNGKEIGRYPRPENATMENWPYNGENSFHLIINNAMSPSWSDDKPPSLDFTEHVLEVDYISVSQKRKEFQ